MILLCCLFSACTHNNGDIGKLFGTWHLVSVDGNVSGYTPDEGDEVYWAFQNTTIKMWAVDAQHTSDNRFGNWRIEQDVLYLDFPDNDNHGVPLLGLPRQCELEVLHLSSKQMQVSYVSENTSETVVFTFRKW